MAAPGWYPDPAGNSGLQRLWDGEGWTTQVRPVGTPRPRRGRLLVGAAAVVVLTVAGVSGIVLSREAPFTEAAGGGAPKAQPVGLIEAPAYCTGGEPTHRATYPENGWLHGGGLTTRTPGAWRPGEVSRVPFASDVVVGETTEATIVVAALRLDDVFESPEEAVPAVETCLRARNPLTSGMLTPAGKAYPTQVAGARAAQRRDYELTGSTPGRVSIIVVDAGQPESLGLLVTVATGAPDGAQAAAVAIDQLRAGQ
ncbi:DUF2510 domain-containing protein [Enemella evansiae]|uniref:DUF2510 domain-containing protein n=1 Tax=Enemella evansiae TaxID=2016499 RepID=UPI00105F565F|nr:DUF2510 domain-containing protein [Enemella evansiae]TDO86213.1 uncharacterized protein DUF2510 [Enemella evansiae]